MTKIFREDYGVYCCSHIFKNERPVLLVVRDKDGSWQFLCGESDDSCECHLVGVGHLLDRDSSLRRMAELSISSGAERQSDTDGWVHFELDEEDQ
ncbi:MAG: hypothetical protein CVV16_14530 [Gammaproteobacteria bacterium HGW-Gammaproteobacteria-6]|jgi:hypothetical protein|nr:MAG: hypothetical protein CVV16_14530 [Gammaproteobacteria bacterium HGW-Gammaproteobacteria-6]